MNKCPFCGHDLQSITSGDFCSNSMCSWIEGYVEAPPAPVEDRHRVLAAKFIIDGEGHKGGEALVERLARFAAEFERQIRLDEQTHHNQPVGKMWEQMRQRRIHELRTLSMKVRVAGA